MVVFGIDGQVPGRRRESAVSVDQTVRGGCKTRPSLSSLDARQFRLIGRPLAADPDAERLEAVVESIDRLSVPGSDSRTVDVLIVVSVHRDLPVWTFAPPLTLSFLGWVREGRIFSAAFDERYSKFSVKTRRDSPIQH